MERAEVVIRRALALSFVFLACKGSDAPRDPWPALPRGAKERQDVVARFTVRAPSPVVPSGAAQVLASARAKKYKGTLAGEEAVVEFLAAWLEKTRAAKRDAYLLVGVRHDSGAAIDAFRRIVGPGGAPFSHVAIEQLAADGRWAGRSEDEQRGDSRVLADYMKSGSQESFAALARAHDERDYTAWKFGYASRVLDVVVAGRARGAILTGCDMSESLKRALRTDGATDDESAHLRELHCFFALRDARTSGASFALLLGAAHVEPEGFRRFLPPDASVLTLRVLDRVAEIAGDMTLIGDERDATLLIPATAVDVDRVRDPAAAGASTLEARATSPVHVFVDGAESEIGPDTRTSDLARGPHVLVVEGEPPLVVAFKSGAGKTELDVDHFARHVHVVVAP